jgi:hypothetical protein
LVLDQYLVQLRVDQLFTASYILGNVVKEIWKLDIRGNIKQINKLKKIKTGIKDVSFNADNNVEVPIIMIQNEKKELVEYLKGYKEIANYLAFGFNRITKQCPYRHRKCIGEKCSLYFIKNGTGDCAHIWNLYK